MPATAVALVVVAAVLHASWNVLTKRAADPLAFLWSSMGVAALGLLPFALFIVRERGLEAAGLPFLGASAAVHALYFVALSTSYRHGDFSSVYSVARGLGVALTPVLAWTLWAERLSPLGVAGIVIVVVGIVLAARRARGSVQPGASRAVSWALLTGLTIATYSILDSSGARRMHPVPFLCGTSIGAVLLCTPLVLRRAPALREEWRKNRRTILLASTMNLSGYLLVLWAYRSSKTGYVTAARELSIAFSPLIGRVVLGEKALGARLVGAVVILAGVVCVALAR